ncbi:PadR family transcriptional regulator [Paenibacillus donghaensis]|uniref:PadR family transcriptional regulator n=1 Tax=Paenibacillus donghaensis TaxID=414771 RepID=UPI001883AB38|nr:PadR family transcriptional regulator [Paenibacillus donghaensis]MBE9915785.1 PadR family transcriptional regulator [Paenibacillus donghaensis]
MNTLSYGLLAFLARESSSGYDVMLKIQPFWQAKHSQIYPLLAQMEENELLTSYWVKQSEKPDKKIYSITDNGIRKLKEWMYKPLPDPVTRDELSMKTFCMWLTDRDNAIEIIESRKAYFLRRLESFRKMLQKIPEDKRGFGNREFYDYILVQKGIFNATAGLDWCSWVLAMLKEQQAKDSTAHSEQSVPSVNQKI